MPVRLAFQSLFRASAVVFIAALFLSVNDAYAQSPSFSVGFPVHDSNGQELNPYTAPITSVVDHYANKFERRDDNVDTVQAYTGEQGFGTRCGGGDPCGRYSPSGLPFAVNGNYDPGTTGDRSYLNYRGHSGIDYAYAEGRRVYAAHDGDLFMAAIDPILGTSDSQYGPSLLSG